MNALNFVGYIGVCYYCGMIATSFDHFIPRVLIKEGLFTEHQRLIPACQQCNSILGARVFPTLALRREAAKAGIRKKYARILNIPEWTEEEIEELGYTLKTRVRAGWKLKQLIRYRLAYRGVLNVEANFSLDENGNGIAQRDAVKLLSKREK